MEGIKLDNLLSSYELKQILKKLSQISRIQRSCTDLVPSLTSHQTYWFDQIYQLTQAYILLRIKAIITK